MANNTTSNNKKEGLTDEEKKRLEEIEKNVDSGGLKEINMSKDQIKETLKQYEGVNSSEGDAITRMYHELLLSDRDRERMAKILHDAYNSSNVKLPPKGAVSYTSSTYVDSNVNSLGNQRGIPVKSIGDKEYIRQLIAKNKKDKHEDYVKGGIYYNPWEDKTLSDKERSEYIKKHGDYRFPVFMGDTLPNGRQYYYNEAEAKFRASGLIEKIAPHYIVPNTDKILPPPGARLTVDGYWIDGNTGKFLGTAPEGYKATGSTALKHKGKWVKDSNGNTRYIIDKNDKIIYSPENSTGYYDDKGYWVVSKNQSEPDENGNIYDQETGKFIGNIYRPGIELGVGYTAPDREICNPIDYKEYGVQESNEYTGQKSDAVDSFIVTNEEDELQIKKNEVFDNRTLDQISASFNLFPRQAVERFDKFSQYGFFDVHDTSTYFKEYLFFTKPHLNLKGLESYDPSYYKLIVEHYGKTMEYLLAGDTGFIPLLTNSVTPGDGAELPDIIPMELETMTNINGAQITYKSQSLESSYNQEFSLSFNDTRFLDVYMLFHFWDTYSTLKALGYMQPLDIYMPPHSILEDQIAVYKITVAEDYRHIVHYAKYTGVYPKIVPKSIFNTMEGGIIKIPITFKAFKVNDMEPWILDEFNAIAGNMSYKGNHLKNKENDWVGFGTGVDNRWKVCPKITKGKYHERPVYFLEWEV